MANRCILHKKHLEKFKQYLLKRGIAFRAGKGRYQVLQVHTHQYGFQCIYDRHDAIEHYTVQDRLIPTVRDFLRQLKDVPNFWTGPGGALLCDVCIDGAQVLEGDAAQYYGGRYFIGETITQTMAKAIASNFYGNYNDKEPAK